MPALAAISSACESAMLKHAGIELVFAKHICRLGAMRATSLSLRVLPGGTRARHQIGTAPTKICPGKRCAAWLPEVAFVSCLTAAWQETLPNRGAGFRLRTAAM